MLTTLLLYASGLEAQLPQNPSPLRDTTRDHTRVLEQQVPGIRTNVSLGSLLLPEGLKPTQLIIHFHSSPWLPEMAARSRFPRAAVLTINLGAGSDVYRLPFTEPNRYRLLIEEAERAAQTKFQTIVLSSFSAGYGAIREILRDKSNFARIQSIILADSLYAGYGNEPDDLNPFLAYIKAGKRLIMTHSELYPGTYAATFEAADWLIKQLGAKRKAILKWGPVGMQQLSEVNIFDFHVLGFAGNSADDHVDHLYGLERWLSIALPPPSPTSRPVMRAAAPAQAHKKP